MADITVPPAMVEAAARLMWEKSRNGIENFTGAPWDELGGDLRDWCCREAASILAAALSVCEVHEEWGVLWHSDDRDDGYVGSQQQFGSRQQAERRGAEKIGQFGIVRYTLERCHHRWFPDGSTWITPWERITTPAEEADRDA